MGIDMSAIDKILAECDAAVKRQQRWTRLTAFIQEQLDALPAQRTDAAHGRAEAYRKVLDWMEAQTVAPTREETQR